MAKAESEEGGGRRSGLSLGADFPLRAATSIVMMAGVLALTWAGGFPFLLLWLAAGVVIIWEWQRLVGGGRIVARTAIGAATLLVASPLALHSAAAYAGLTTLIGAVVTGWVAERGRGFEAGAGVVYAGVMTVGANLLRASPEYGLAATLWLFAVVWGTDVMAYMGGRLIGGPKLWRRVSPGKTWSGAVIGALASAPIGAAVAALASPTPVRWLAMALMGLIVSIAAQAGDLFESALKRRAGVKDSSRLIPGHGGVMDRLDGFVVAVALTAAIGYARASGQWIAAGLFQW